MKISHLNEIFKNKNKNNIEWMEYFKLWMKNGK